MTVASKAGLCRAFGLAAACRQPRLIIMMGADSMLAATAAAAYPISYHHVHLRIRDRAPLEALHLFMACSSVLPE